jgi:hypothetical protein
MRISYPNILPIAGGIVGIAMALSYYLSVMIAQLFIGRPSSTWILGIIWLPVFLIKPGLVGLLIGSLAWLLIRPFRVSRLLLPTEIKAFKIFICLLLIGSVVAGVIKVAKGAH